MANERSIFTEPQRYDSQDYHISPVYFETTAAAQDINVFIFQVWRKPIRVLKVEAQFSVIDTFASGVDIDLETDDGTTETVIATYDTASGTDVDTVYEFAYITDLRVEEGERLQLHVNDDEDAACVGVVAIHWVELDE